MKSALLIRHLRNTLVFGSPLFADYDSAANASNLNMSLLDYEYLMGLSGLILAVLLIGGLIRALR